MKASNSLWREQPLDEALPELVREIEIYETEIELRKQGKLDEKLFAETRLRRGAYGQRYDNGQRWDGKETQTLPFPSSSTELTKGANTVWMPRHARIKVPFGGMNPPAVGSMLNCRAYLMDRARYYASGFQLHFVLRHTLLAARLAAVGITTREACGNSVRNVTACPFSGVCSTESFDVTPYAKGLAYFLLGHPDVQDFGRKFKVAFSGCKDEACGLVNMNDMGVIAAKRIVDVWKHAASVIYVADLYSASPASCSNAFLPEEECSHAQAFHVCSHGWVKRRIATAPASNSSWHSLESKSSSAWYLRSAPACRTIRVGQSIYLRSMRWMKSHCARLSP